MKFLFAIFTLGIFLSLPIVAQESEKEWTVLVYLNGDNDLNLFGDQDLKEMMNVGSNANLNIIVLRDFGRRASSKIYYVERGRVQTLLDYGLNVDTGDYKNLIDFFAFVQKNYPARHYLLDVWNHGLGWLDSYPRYEEKGVSYDDTSHHFISASDLGVALSKIQAINGGKKIDILGFDACLMAQAEIIQQVSSSVDYLVGSEEVEPDEGWNYADFLKALAYHPLISPRALSDAMVNSYISSYPRGKVTQSAIDVSRFLQANDFVKDFALYSKEVVFKDPAFRLAKYGAISYSVKSYKDFVHFLRLVSLETKDFILKKKADDLINALSESVLRAGNVGIANSTGISVWIPSNLTDMPTYKTLSWAKETSWDELLENLSLL